MHLLLSLPCGSGVGLCFWEQQDLGVGGGGSLLTVEGGSVGELDFLVFTGEPVRNPPGECQVNIQTAVGPLLCPPGSLGCVYGSGHCLLCGCLLPG